jgi:hypothetical protein
MSNRSPENGRERRLRELAGRLLVHPSPEGPTTAELFLAELPPDVPADLIVPGDLDLFGSLAISDFLSAYERDLESHGWRRF